VSTLPTFRAAALIVEAAESAGLPMPCWTTISGQRGVEFQMSTLDDLAAWALFIEAPITDRPLSKSFGVIRTVEARLCEQAVKLYTVSLTESVQRFEVTA